MSSSSDEYSDFESEPPSPSIQYAESVYTYCSHQASDDLTVSDKPGTGRTLGLLYSRWGRVLEMSMNRLAQRRGYGPHALAITIERAFFDGEQHEYGIEWRVANEDEKSFSERCLKLVRYTTSQTPSTQLKALHEIIRLITTQPLLRPYFRCERALRYLTDLLTARDSKCCLETDPDVMFLARRAIMCIEDNNLNNLFDRIQLRGLCKVSQRITYTKMEHSASMLQLLDYCCVDHYSFVAKRYMYTALQHQPWTSITDWSNDTFRHELFKVLEKIINLSIDGQMGDIEGTERLIMIVLLPRYCPVHFNRCTRVDSLPVAEFKGDILLDGMKNLLTALQCERARALFPRVSMVAEDTWEALSAKRCLLS